MRTAPRTITKHFYADGLQVAKMAGGSAYYLHQDALGSMRLEVTAAVTTVFSSNYVPYGASYGSVGKEEFMYIGRQYDASTGLYYMMARYFDTTIGRFITEDCFNGTKNDPLSQNRYVYARDNPEKNTDPNGHRLAISVGGGGDWSGIGFPYFLIKTTVQVVSSSTTYEYVNSQETYKITVYTVSFTVWYDNTLPFLTSTTTVKTTEDLSSGQCTEQIGSDILHSTEVWGFTEFGEIALGEVSTSYGLGLEISGTVLCVPCVGFLLAIPLAFVAIQLYNEYNNVQCGP